jgi:hypothetical protein
MRHAPAAMLLLVLRAAPAVGEGPVPTDDAWPVRSRGHLSVDAGMILGTPAAWQTGLSAGVGAGCLVGRRWAWGVRASWSTATESSLAWSVTRQDMRLRGVGAVQHTAGRGTFALRLGLGPTLVHENRQRNQGMRAQLTGSDLETSVFTTLPAADLEAVVAVHVAGPWLLILCGGPSALIATGTLHGGWTTMLGAGWQP